MHAHSAAGDFGVEAREHYGDGQEDEECYDCYNRMCANQILIAVHFLEAVTHAYATLVSYMLLAEGIAIGQPYHCSA